MSRSRDGGGMFLYPTAEDRLSCKCLRVVCVCALNLSIASCNTTPSCLDWKALYSIKLLNTVMKCDGPPLDTSMWLVYLRESKTDAKACVLFQCDKRVGRRNRNFLSQSHVRDLARDQCVLRVIRSLPKRLANLTDGIAFGIDSPGQLPTYPPSTPYFAID
jgi:hypothetical protein